MRLSSYLYLHNKEFRSQQIKKIEYPHTNGRARLAVSIKKKKDFFISWL
jgi:hypothetical protein